MQEDVRHRPQMTPTEACRLASKLYGVEATARELPSERDQNFDLQCRSGDRFVLKIANTGAPRDNLDCQNQAMQRIAEQCGGAICPTACETTAGELITQISTPDGGHHFVRMVTWVPGSPLGEAKSASSELLRSVGSLLGRIGNALAEFSHPAAVRTFPWDLGNSREVIGTHSESIADSGRRELISHFVTSYEAIVVPQLGLLQRSVIHNDANDFNVMVGDGPATGGETSELQATGLIDFGDIVFSCRVYDLAICLAYVMLEKSDPIGAAAHVVAGYHEVLSLTETELAVLFPLACMRLCTSVSMSAYQRQRAPENEYLSISEKSAWALLEQLQEVSPPTAHKAFLVACQGDTSYEELLAKRTALLGKSLSVSYRRPLKIVRGRGQYLYDASGREYLDCVNNVCHVGHCHPHVVAAATRQMARLNTNTRYLHDALVNYAERLTATLPERLSVCYFVNSGSEANDLALRLARAYTGGTEIVTVDGAYHGNLSSLIDISPYKFAGPGGHGAPPFVHTTIMPDGYRGPYRYDDPEAGRKYAEHVQAALLEIHQAKEKVAALFCESLLSCGGQIVLPDGYLREAYQHVRAVGGVCVADEVQVGFGRVGSHFWGFETQGVVPDIVTMGKPIGNGHPLGAVVTTPEIAAAFANGMEYFNTYGGNPVSSEVGLAVLETIQSEGLQAHAQQVGSELKESLKTLISKHAVVGDVRGLGMFLGIELVQDRDTLDPAADVASHLVERAKEEGILLSTDGPLHNVVKFKPPLPFSAENAERLVATLDNILSEG